jgi:acyl-CoA synthetase (AMP-forming)/AMP-acid ligase II
MNSSPRGNRRHIADALDRWGAATPDREVVRFADSSWTWAQWADRVRRHAAGQLAAGVRPGERVAFLDKNHPACLETTMACAVAGTANAIFNSRLAADEIVYLLNDSEARLLFVGHELAPMIESIRHWCPALAEVVVVGGPHDEYEPWLAGQTPLSGRHDGERCFLQLYTSGTTGFPKGAMLTHDGVIAHCEHGAQDFSFSTESVAQVAMPLFHVGGTAWALMALWAGGRMVIHREIDFAEVVDAVADHGVSHTFLVPAVLQGLVSLPGVRDRDLSSLEVISYGASPIPAPLLRQCLDTFDADFLGLYGMTETSGILTALPREAHRDPANPHRLLSVGKPITGVELRVVDPDTGRDVGIDEVGEVWVRSEQTLMGYWRRSDAVLGPEGWFRTGDAGRLDADGYLYITDRIKDMLISGGENVYPAEVERVLVEHPSVGEVAVLGIPSERWGETPKAFVVPAPGAVVDAAELIAYCRDRLAAYKCPTEVDVIAELPRNPTGKVLKRELRAMSARAGSTVS